MISFIKRKNILFSHFIPNNICPTPLPHPKHKNRYEQAEGIKTGITLTPISQPILLL